jgi:hypothetical protein
MPGNRVERAVDLVRRQRPERRAHGVDGPFAVEVAATLHCEQIHRNADEAVGRQLIGHAA